MKKKSLTQSHENRLENSGCLTDLTTVHYVTVKAYGKKNK